MKNFGKVSKIRKIVGGLFLGSGVFFILGALFNADGASIGAGIFNTVLGILFLSPKARD